MDYKPADLFVGLVDFFSILLPGAIFTFAFQGFAQQHILGHVLPAIETAAAGWVAFAFSAYLFGQLLSLLGAAYMDQLFDALYLPKKQKKSGDYGFKKVDAIAANRPASTSLRTWTRSYVRLHHPEASLDIDRVEATSKFFRALVVLMCLFALVATVLLAVRRDATYAMDAVACLFLMLLSFWRFCDQRWKATERTFTYYLLLCHGQESATKTDTP